MRQVSLSGKVAVVTGGAGGIGNAISRRLVAEGAKVAVLDRETAESGEGLTVLPVDVGNAESVNSAFADVVALLGVPAVVVNAAGIHANVPFVDTTVELWNEIMRINGLGTFIVGRAVARLLIEAGAGGRIINILSTASELAFAGDSAYCASKAAAMATTRVMAVELGPYGIEVNGVAPGWIDTQMGRNYHQDQAIVAHEFVRTPLQRFGEPDDVAEAVAWLATRSRWIAGQILYVDGGFMATGGPPPEVLHASSQQ